MYSYIEHPEKPVIAGYAAKPVFKQAPLNNDIVLQTTSLEFTMNDIVFEHISKIQQFTYRCISLFGPNGNRPNTALQEKHQLLDIWVSRIFEDYRYELTFDETIWPPSDKTARGKIIKLTTNAHYGSITIVTPIDLREPNNEIFNINYMLPDILT